MFLCLWVSNKKKNLSIYLALPTYKRIRIDYFTQIFIKTKYHNHKLLRGKYVISNYKNHIKLKSGACKNRKKYYEENT